MAQDELLPGPGRMPPRWALVLGALLAGCLVIVAVVRAVDRAGPSPRAAHPATTQVSTSSAAPTPLRTTQGAALAAMPPATVAAIALAPGGASLERRDLAAPNGPWTVTVRRTDGGSFGHLSAVVTFPVPAVAPRTSVQVGTAVGTFDGADLVWPLADRHARVRGDPQLGAGHPRQPGARGDPQLRELVAIAARTQIRAGRPVVTPPAGYTVVATGPYRSLVIREMRWGETGGSLQTVAALVYTGVARGGGFEDQ